MLDWVFKGIALTFIVVFAIKIGFIAFTVLCVGFMQLVLLGRFVKWMLEGNEEKVKD